MALAVALKMSSPKHARSMIGDENVEFFISIQQKLFNLLVAYNQQEMPHVMCVPVFIPTLTPFQKYIIIGQPFFLIEKLK